MVAPLDVERAARIAAGIPIKLERSKALSGVVAVAVAVDPERAERLARAHAKGPAMLRISARVARAMPAGDPRRDDVLSHVYQLAGSTIDYADMCTDDIAEIVEAFGAGAADRALGIAQGMEAGVRKAYLLACIARQWEQSDPARAGRLISDAHWLVGMVRAPYQKALTLVDIARLWA